MAQQHRPDREGAAEPHGEELQANKRVPSWAELKEILLELDARLKKLEDATGCSAASSS